MGLEILKEPVVATFVSAIPAMFLAYLSWKKAMGSDRVAEQSGLATDRREGAAMVIESLHKHTETLQEELSSARVERDDWREKYYQVSQELEALKKTR